ncbi:MAG: peptide ABC transporter substrate-binding protein [Deltaproteobacteria bacterium]|nr:MAG: peptide ABC transporter substrate-binding protein [Deltaproteobacteria bacterium]
MKGEAILEAKNIKKYFLMGKEGIFSKKARMIKAVDGINFSLYKGQTFGLVGESGCGKSTIGRCILRLYRITDGEMLFQGKNIDIFDGKEKMQYRRDVQAVFQDPYGSLNPRMRVGEFIEEPMLVHGILNSRGRRERVKKLLEVVGLSADQARRFPHEFSGGQRQRICIARALSLNPKLLILDEPVSALDVSIRAQILNLLMDLQEEFGLTYLFISHDLSVVEHISDLVAVMYLAKIVEMAPCERIFKNPLHPYTQALLSAIPVPDPELAQEAIILEGDITDPITLEKGCPFRNRCFNASEECTEKEPKLIEVEPNHLVACLKIR